VSRPQHILQAVQDDENGEILIAAAEDPNPSGTEAADTGHEPPPDSQDEEEEEPRPDAEPDAHDDAEDPIPPPDERMEHDFSS